MKCSAQIFMLAAFAALCTVSCNKFLDDINTSQIDTATNADTNTGTGKGTGADNDTATSTTGADSASSTGSENDSTSTDDSSSLSDSEDSASATSVDTDSASATESDSASDTADTGTDSDTRSAMDRCMETCTDECMNCDTDANCVAVAENLPDPKNICDNEETNPCGTNGMCNGAGGCQYKINNDTTVCNAICDSDEETRFTCDLDAHTCSVEATQTCINGCSSDGSICNNPCVSDTDCDIDAQFCCQSADAGITGCTEGACANRIARGGDAECSADRHCNLESVCSEDHVCCNEACIGPCNVCTGIDTPGATRGACDAPFTDARCVDVNNCNSQFRYEITGTNDFGESSACELATYENRATVPSCLTASRECEPWIDWCLEKDRTIKATAGQCAKFRDGSCDAQDTYEFDYAAVAHSCNDGSWCSGDNDHCEGNSDACIANPVFHSCGIVNVTYTDCVDNDTEGISGTCTCVSDEWTGDNCDVRIFYVAAGGLGTGSSWVDAMGSIPNALTAANVALNTPGGSATSCEIRVAAGVYHIYQGSINDTISMKANVTLLGGFPPTGGDLSQRDPMLPNNYTILSGEQSGVPTNRVAHVVSCVETGGCGANAVLDGFIVGGGFAADPVTSTTTTTNIGGGMLISGNVSPTVRKVVFTDNNAYLRGGAVAIFQATGEARFERCFFTNNAVTHAAAIVDSGGAFYAINSAGVSFDSVAFTGNSTYSSGGAIYLYGLASPSLVNNSVLLGNYAYGSENDSYGGSAISVTNSSIQIDNSTIAYNFANTARATEPGAILGVGAGSIINLQNTIVSKNETMEYDITLRPLAGATVTHSFVDDQCVCATTCDGNNSTYTNYSVATNLNVLTSPTFETVTNETGAWSSIDTAPMYQTTLIYPNNVWAAGELAGKYVQPDVNHKLAFYIVSNTSNSITVWGDIESWLAIPSNFKIWSLDQTAGSSVINAANAASSTEFDFKGQLRDATPDIGAYEY
ncbi:MAG: hypothetical protein JXR76_30570 [Deltaproteobacteria bacterium]|nr:hypothetical protein [Deltaproteobacteria bacterium]